MSMKKAIYKAIEGGWRHKSGYSWPKTCLDPLFWQSLGKALGWPSMIQPYQTGNGNWKEIYWWEYKWHEFINHLAEGKSPESFFDTLLQDK